VGDETELTSLLAEAGLDLDSQRTLLHRSGADLTWIMLLVLPLQAALATLGTGVMNDLYLAVRRLAQRGRLGPAPKPMILEDPDTGLQIVLEADLPPEAITALTALDLREFRKGPVHFDRTRMAWRSEIDEAER
jgi:hypothetical protein